MGNCIKSLNNRPKKSSDILIDTTKHLDLKSFDDVGSEN